MLKFFLTYPGSGIFVKTIKVLIRLDQTARTAPGIGAALMGRKINYPLPRPTWVCPHCGFVHHATDIVRRDDEGLLCKQCGEAFTPPSAERRSPSIGFRDSD
jgi:hypothetical protein